MFTLYVLRFYPNQQYLREGFDVGDLCAEAEKLLCSLSRAIPGGGRAGSRGQVCSFLGSKELGRRASFRHHWSTAQAMFVGIFFS